MVPSHDLEAHAAALASLPSISPTRLTALVRAFGFASAWERVCGARVLEHRAVARTLGPAGHDVERQWAAAARGIDPSALHRAHTDAGIQIVPLGSDGYPTALAADIEPPAVLFARGDLDSVSGARVAIVGTRRCTRSGRLIATELGLDLARAGVRVVSGLALGIDGAAHEGALRAEGGAPVIGVAGTGLDVVYPKRHTALWHAVAERGALVSEVPLGGGAFPWRFPARNRIIAALADLVVIVESHSTGGALHTVDEAIRRDRAVMVVPGSVRSPASRGTNALLHDGLGPARDAADVLTALGFVHTDPVVVQPGPELQQLALEGLRLDPLDVDLLELLGGEPVNVDHLVTASGRSVGEVALGLVHLEERGLVARSGSWVERVR